MIKTMKKPAYEKRNDGDICSYLRGDAFGYRLCRYGAKCKKGNRKNRSDRESGK